GVVDYEPTELVVTACCGTSLLELEQTLAAQHQMLAFEPPHFGPSATVGGMMAAGLSGPRRASAGALRDFVLGAVLLDGRGELLHFGGQVMKNVAGYDVSRLLAGSLGSLGLILQASFKVLPQAAQCISCVFEIDQISALERLNQWGGQPLPISASAWQGDRLVLRLEGAAAGLTSARSKLGGELLPQAEANQFWSDLREQRLPFFDTDQAIWRLSLPSTAPPVALAGAELLEWGGAQRWLLPALGVTAAQIRQRAQTLGGHATLWRADDKSAGVFQPLAPALQAIHQRLKQNFDPDAIFNPGRMYLDL
ncbi:MAG: glycolate oxidase subunit GlcE, partial [Herbaspirillum sp.]